MSDLATLKRIFSTKHSRETRAETLYLLARSMQPEEGIPLLVMALSLAEDFPPLRQAAVDAVWMLEISETPIAERIPDACSILRQAVAAHDGEEATESLFRERNEEEAKP